MAIPISYNIRNLTVRKTTTIMTALGIALTVAVLLAILALVDGLRTSLAATGDPLDVLVMRKGSTSELSSNFNRSAYQDLKFKPGIARSKSGHLSARRCHRRQHPTRTRAAAKKLTLPRAVRIVGS